MICAESLKLENNYRLRYERARSVELGGPMVVMAGNQHDHSLLVRQHRTQQTQAANAILMHQRICSICSNEHAMPASLAS